MIIVNDSRSNVYERSIACHIEKDSPMSCIAIKRRSGKSSKMARRIMLRNLLVTSIPIRLSIATHISYREEPVSTDNLLTDRRNNAQHLYSGICGFKLIVIAPFIVESLDSNAIKSYWLIKLNPLVCNNIRFRRRAFLGIRTSESNGTIA